MKIYNVADQIEQFENESDLIQLSGHLSGESENPEIRRPEKTSKPVNVIGFDRFSKLRIMPRVFKHGFDMFFRSSKDKAENFILEIPYATSVILMMCGGGGGLLHDGGDTMCLINGLQQIAFGGKTKGGPIGGGYSVDAGKEQKTINTASPEAATAGRITRFNGNRWSGMMSTGGGGSDKFGGGCGMFVDFHKSLNFSGSISNGSFIGGNGEQTDCPPIGFGGGRINAGGGGFVFLNFEVSNRTTITGSVPGHENHDSTGGAICIWF